MRRIAVLSIIFSLILASCEMKGKKITIGDPVITNQRCMATSNEFAYDEMQAASDRKDERPLMDMMNKGELLILNNGQPGKVVWVEKEKSQIEILGGSKWWVANKFLKIK